MPTQQRRSANTLVVGALFFLINVVVVEGQATRTWVSGVGDDVNPCSRTAPCFTFAGALAKTAVNGEIDSLDPGVFGMLTITQSITIDGLGLGGVSSINATINATAIVIDASVNDSITIRNVNLLGLGAARAGIQVIGAGSVTLENLQIRGFTYGLELFTTALPSARAEINMANVHIEASTVGVAVGVNGSASDNLKVSLFDVIINGCGTGVQLLSGATTISDSVIAQNTGAGVEADATADLIENYIESNAVGLDVGTNGVVVAVANNFLANTQAIQCHSPLLDPSASNLLSPSATLPAECIPVVPTTTITSSSTTSSGSQLSNLFHVLANYF